MIMNNNRIIIEYKINKNIIGYIHIFLAILKDIYGYIFPQILLLDTIYLIIFACIPLLWIINKGECVISYYCKKCENPDYELGKEPFKHNDVSELFPNKIYYTIFSNISTFVYIGSLIIVNYRSRIIPNYLLYITIILLLVYIYDMDLYDSYYTGRMFPYFHGFLGAILIIIIILCMKNYII
jgi:hypothetical protein